MLEHDGVSRIAPHCLFIGDGGETASELLASDACRDALRTAFLVDVVAG
jgi:hypothetical protein